MSKLKTIAKMKMVLPDGRKLPFKHDFGYDYKKSDAEYMFFEGNYSCDCNKYIFLSKYYPDIKEFDCGDKIKIIDFEVVSEL